MPISSITSRTPLRGLFPSLHFRVSVMSAFHPKKARTRAIILALLTLICLFTFVFDSLSPSIALRRSDMAAAADQIAVALETVRDSRAAAAAAASRHKQPPNKWRTQQLKLTPAQELAAISSFLESLPQNVIPSSVDPTHPIDPQLVLDFDTRSPRAADEVEAMVDDVWSRNPVMLYSKLYSPASREIKTILSDMHLHPPPTIMDVDIRDDVDVLTPLLFRLTSSTELPVLLIGGVSVGSITKIRALHRSGELRQMIQASGAILDRRHKNGKRK